MRSRWIHLCFLMLKLFIVTLFLAPFLESAKGAESSDLYSPPQAVFMGNAITADAQGYLANYYNPAGLAKLTKRRPEYLPVDLLIDANGAGAGRVINAQSLGIRRLVSKVMENPGDYHYFKFSASPGYSRRGLAVNLLGAYQFAARTNAENPALVDSDSRLDVGALVGFAQSFAGNVVRLGVTGKFLLRNELKGTFEPAALTTDETIMANMKSGWAVGGDAGIQLTLPVRYLPTLGVVWKDLFNTSFRSSSVLNGSANGIPDSLPQSFNAALSVHPSLGKRLKATLAAEWKHIEKTTWPITKRLHFGFQLEDERSFYLWAGLNQMLPTGGVGLRVKGGNLEIGSYALDIGEDAESEGSRRFLMRYTISF